MKRIKYISIPLLLLFLLPACDKTSEKPSENDPLPNFIIRFEITDSLDNNLIPYPLPENPYLHPEDFYATTNLKEGNIGSYGIIQGRGYIFRMSVTMDEIRGNPGWQQDSTFRFYPVIGSDIDTVTIHKTSFLVTDLGGMSFANSIIWNQDTLGDYHNELLSIQK